MECRFRFAVAGGRPSGCYLLMQKGVVVYVGKSENLFARISTHWGAVQRRKQGLYVAAQQIAEEKIIDFDSVELIPLPMKDLAREEIRLIQAYQPKFNVLLKRKQIAPGLEDKIQFKELLKKKQELKIRRLVVLNV